MSSKNKNGTFHILLADDDKDDQLFFDKALRTLPFATHFVTVEDGKKLIEYLSKNYKNLPDILFLDLNMPRKNGSECLVEIKEDPKLKQLPIVIYSTSLHEDVADLLYEKGAHYYIRKTDLPDLEKILLRLITTIRKNNFARPSREDFIVNMVDV
jgi:CheY-like chemotaxis protein